MKKVLTILVLIVTLGSYAQTESTTTKEVVTKTEKFQDIVKEYLTSTVEFVKEEGGKVYNLAKQEIPVVIKQWLMFEAIQYWLLVLGGILLAFYGTKYTRKFWDGEVEPFIILTIPGAIIGVALFVINIMTAIKVTFFPKLYLVEKFIDLI